MYGFREEFDRTPSATSKSGRASSRARSSRQFLASIPNRIGVGGRDDYRKFIIVCQARTGSNLLTTLLRSVPSIVAFGEILSAARSVAWGNRTLAPIYRRHSQRLRDLDARQFIEDVVFRPYPEFIDAAGFKAFYHHLERRSSALEALQSIDGLTVIHLRRKNLLAMAVSKAQAHATNEWTKSSASSFDRIDPVHLDVSSMLKDFESYERREDWPLVNLPRANVLELGYEDVSHDPVASLAPVFDALSVVSATTVSTRLIKQNNLGWRNSVSNVDEVERALARTRWGHLLNLAD